MSPPHCLHSSTDGGRHLFKCKYSVGQNYTPLVCCLVPWHSQILSCSYKIKFGSVMLYLLYLLKYSTLTSTHYVWSTTEYTCKVRLQRAQCHFSRHTIWLKYTFYAQLSSLTADVLALSPLTMMQHCMLLLELMDQCTWLVSACSISVNKCSAILSLKFALFHLASEMTYLDYNGQLEEEHVTPIEAHSPGEFFEHY